MSTTPNNTIITNPGHAHAEPTEELRMAITECRYVAGQIADSLSGQPDPATIQRTKQAALAMVAAFEEIEHGLIPPGTVGLGRDYIRRQLVVLAEELGKQTGPIRSANVRHLHARLCQIADLVGGVHTASRPELSDPLADEGKWREKFAQLVEQDRGASLDVVYAWAMRSRERDPFEVVELTNEQIVNLGARLRREAMTLMRQPPDAETLFGIAVGRCHRALGDVGRIQDDLLDASCTDADLLTRLDGIEFELGIVLSQIREHGGGYKLKLAAELEDEG